MTAVLDDVDEVAVERACEGDRSVPLTPAEMAAAMAQLEGRGLSARRIGEVLGVSSRSVVRWRNGHTKPARRPYRALCGTRAGWHRHWRLGEPRCVECREAKNAYARQCRRRRAAA